MQICICWWSYLFIHAIFCQICYFEGFSFFYHNLQLQAVRASFVFIFQMDTHFQLLYHIIFKPICLYCRIFTSAIQLHKFDFCFPCYSWLNLCYHTELNSVILKFSVHRHWFSFLKLAFFNYKICLHFLTLHCLNHNTFMFKQMVCLYMLYKGTVCPVKISWGPVCAKKRGQETMEESVAHRC